MRLWYSCWHKAKDPRHTHAHAHTAMVSYTVSPQSAPHYTSTCGASTEGGYLKGHLKGCIKKKPYSRDAWSYGRLGLVITIRDSPGPWVSHRFGEGIMVVGEHCAKKGWKGGQIQVWSKSVTEISQMACYER